MRNNLKNTLISAFVCIFGSLILSSCYTVKGAVNGAGEDVSVLTGQGNSHSHHHKVHHKTVKTHKTSVKKPAQPASAPASTTSPTT